jgi:hypothetical protein
MPSPGGPAQSPQRLGPRAPRPGCFALDYDGGVAWLSDSGDQRRLYRRPLWNPGDFLPSRGFGHARKPRTVLHGIRA